MKTRTFLGVILFFGVIVLLASIAAPRQTISRAVGAAYVEDLNIEEPMTPAEGGERINGTLRNPQSGTASAEPPSETLFKAWDGDRVSAPRVISDTGKYRIWYDGMELSGSDQIWSLGLAESRDGSSWTKYAGNPILTLGNEGEWDSFYRGQVSILKEDGTYKMWYTGSNGGPWQTGYATSTDGIAWDLYAGNPVLSVGEGGSWDEIEANAPTVIKDGSVYKMWYHGCNADYAACGIGYATSSNGTDWTKYAGNPVLSGMPGEWDETALLWPAVIKNGSIYEMWYTTWGGIIGHATSPDGIVWTKNPANPVLSEGWSGGHPSQPTVLLENGTYKMWFRHGSGGDTSIGYAESPDGFNWTLLANNPVLTPGQTWYARLPLVLNHHDLSSIHLIFHNGSLLTMEGESWDAEAIAVRGNYIVAVGTDAEVLALQGPGTTVIDLGRRTLMPGFVDAHTHIFNDAWRWGLDMEGTQQLALREGITTLANMYTEDYFVDEMRTFESEGKLIIRTSLYLIYNDACGEVRGDWYLDHPPTRGFGEMLRIGGVKIFSDGGACGEPAISVEYPEELGGGYGDLWLSQAELSQAITQADAAGYQIAIHAWGDRAVDTVLNAYKSALAGQSNTLRHRIEHSNLVRPELRSLYGEIGLVPAIIGYSWTCSIVAGQNWPPILGPENLSWIRNYRALVDANPGLHFTWHGDDPWIGPISPILELYGLVTRKEIAEDGVTICVPPAWLEATGLTVEEALPMMTIEAAYALFREQEVGSLKAGKLADLVVLSDNPTTVDPDDIKDIEVWMTMVGGEVEYCAPGHKAVCPGD